LKQIIQTDYEASYTPVGIANTRNGYSRPTLLALPNFKKYYLSKGLIILPTIMSTIIYKAEG